MAGVTHKTLEWVWLCLEPSKSVPAFLTPSTLNFFLLLSPLCFLLGISLH